MEYIVYILFVVLGIIFVASFLRKRKQDKRRKSRKFMDGYNKRDS